MNKQIVPEITPDQLVDLMGDLSHNAQLATGCFRQCSSEPRLMDFKFTLAAIKTFVNQLEKQFISNASSEELTAYLDQLRVQGRRYKIDPLERLETTPIKDIPWIDTQ